MSNRGRSKLTPADFLPALLVLAVPALMALGGSGSAAVRAGAARVAPRPRLAAAGAGEYVVTTLARTLGRPTGIALDPQGDVVFAEETPAGAAPAAGAVARVDAVTGELRVLYVGRSAAARVAVDGAGVVYWTDPPAGSILALRPGDVEPSTVASGLASPSGVAVDAAGRVVFTEVTPPGAAATVAAVSRLEGGAARVLRSGQAGPTSVAAAPGGDLYWTATDAGAIVRLGADGRVQTVLDGLRTPVAVAVDPTGTRLAFTEVPVPGGGPDAGNTVNVLDLASGARTVVARGDPEPLGVAIGADGVVYWTSASRGRIEQGIPRRALFRFCRPPEDDNRGMPTTRPITARVHLTGGAVVPPVDTTASGSGCFVLQPGGAGAVTQEGLDWTVLVRNLPDGATCNLRLGAPAENGPVVAFLFDLTNVSSPPDEPSFGGAAGVVRPSDLTGPLAGNWAGFVTAFRGGQLYAQADTTAHPDGEIRGQLVPPGGTANLPPRGFILDPHRDVTVAPGAAVRFAGAATDLDGDMVTVLWSFGDGTTSTDLVPTGGHAYANPGTYTVTFTATDAQGLADPDPPHRRVRVEATPEPTPTPTPPQGATPTPTPTPEGTPTPTPPPENVTLSSLQERVFTPRCAWCHGDAAGLNLWPGHSYADLVNVPATTQPGIRVVPGDPASSVLVVKLASGHARVPAPWRARIAAWIAAGALNN